VIGSNGTGKSRLLGAIATTFSRLDRTQSSKTLRRSQVVKIEYEVDGNLVELSSFDNIGLNYLKDRKLLPTRVISVSLTPHDKFPLQRTVIDGDVRDDFYSYVGLRDRTNRASVSALLYRAIENLSSKKTEDEAFRIGNVFKLLGYNPKISAHIDLRISKNLDMAANSQNDLFESYQNDTFLNYKMKKAVHSGRYTETDLKDAIRYAANLRNTKSGILIELDLGENFKSTNVDMTPIRILRSLGLIRLSNVYVHKLNGAIVDLNNASSGEISMITAFISIASTIQNGSLILLDEPETSLHPEWQGKYVELMREVFRNFSGCHYILATHSPLIISDTPSDSFVYSLDRDHLIEGQKLSGKSSDYLLANAFDVIQPENYYLKEEVAEAMRMVASGEYHTKKYKLLISELQRMSDLIEEEHPIRAAIAELGRLAEQ